MASNKDNNEHSKEHATRKRRKYQFAPIDKFDTGAVKTISASQLRGKPTAKMIKKDDLKVKTPLKNKTRKLNRPSVEICPDKSRDEVIWGYQPSDISDKTRSPIDVHDDVDLIDNKYRNPSSTPLIDSRWKTLVSLDNIGGNKTGINTPINNNELSKKVNIDNTVNNTKERFHTLPKLNEKTKLIPHARRSNTERGHRDFDAILNDIKYDSLANNNDNNSDNISNRSFNELPSSPTRINTYDSNKKAITRNDSIEEITGILRNQRHESLTVSFGDSSGNSLIEALSQNPNTIKRSRKIINIDSPNISSISIDSSLLNKKETRANKSIERIEIITDPEIDNNESITNKFTEISNLSSDFSNENDNVKNTTAQKRANSTLALELDLDTADDSDELSKLTNAKAGPDKVNIIDELSDSDDDDLLEFLEDTKPKKESTVPLSESNAVILETEDSKYMDLAKTSVVKPGIVRFTICSIKQLRLPKIGVQKILTCVDANGNKTNVIVRKPWVYLNLEQGDVIHIIEGTKFSNKRLLSDDIDPNTKALNDNLLVVNPDILLSATTIGQFLHCRRSGMIQQFFEDTRGDTSLPMTIGNIVHELLQDCLKYKLSHNTVEKQYLESKLDQLLEVYSFAIIICNETVDNCRIEIMKTHVPNILQFVNGFVNKDNRRCYVSQQGSTKSVPISISNIIDIEENIWAPSYGFKGFLDATVVAHIESNHCIVPLEVKTGKRKDISHEVQGLIYTLLLHDRYDIAVEFTLLYYTRETTMTQFVNKARSVKDALMIRNQIAYYLKYRLTEIDTNGISPFHIPSMEESGSCDRCSDRVESIVLHKLFNEPMLNSIEDYEQTTGHLEKNISLYRDFFLKYNDLITKEESSTTCKNQDFFLVDGNTRELASGLCISNLSIENFIPDVTNRDKYLYTFIRHDISPETLSMLQSQIHINDYVYISDEIGHFAISQGTVVDVNESSITISSKRQLLTNKHENTSKMHEESDSVQSVLIPSINLHDDDILSQNKVTYRVDKNNIRESMSTSRFNLLNLFLPSVPEGQILVDEKTGKERMSKKSDGGDSKLRKLIIDNASPSFVPIDENPPLIYDVTELNYMNEDQKNAIDKSLRCKDYSLILGMPGTGKTTVIAQLIKIIVANGKSVLLTSYTHSAVDNILLKLIDTDINMIRLGSKHRINSQLQHLQPNYSNIKTYDEYIQYIDQMSVVATTCLGIKDLLFSMKTRDFDYVILDEASQISLPVALGPLRFGNKFIMVGDHYQLPPLVKNVIAKENGFEESMFKQLCEKQPESVIELTYQYRMCGDIVQLSNKLIYQEKLKCGTQEVFEQSLNVLDNYSEIIDKYKNIGFEAEKINWLLEALNPQNKVIFLNCDQVPNMNEEANKDNITNIGECVIVKQLVESFSHCNIKMNSIGVISIYRAQLLLLKRQLHVFEKEGLDILTADQFQGKDKDCIIISLVRNNTELNSGALLKDIRRMNVALTRSRKKLVIIGSLRLLKSINELSSLISLLIENNWVHNLPANALDIYNFETEMSSCN